MYDLRWVGQQGLSEEAVCKQRPLRGKEEKQGSKGVWWKSVPNTRNRTCKCLRVEPHPERSRDDEEISGKSLRGIMVYREEKQRMCCCCCFPLWIDKCLCGTFLGWLHVKSLWALEISDFLRRCVFISRVLCGGLGRGSPEGPRVSLKLAAECAEQ